MRKAKPCFIIFISFILMLSVTTTGETRSYQTWCKSFSTGENLTCSTHTDHGGTYSYFPGVAPTIYHVPDNVLFNVRYEAPGHDSTVFSMFLDSNVSSCQKGGNCNFASGEWKTGCVWNGLDSWVCTIHHNEALINQYYLLADYTARNYKYLGLIGTSNSPPIITDISPISYPENAGPLPNIVDLWFYTGDDKTPKQELKYEIVNQTNLGVVACAVSSNRHISCSTQPSAHGFSDITFSAKDSLGATTSSTFRITITPAKAPHSPPAAGEKLAVPSTSAGGAMPPKTPQENPKQ